jgi:ABC-type multidrug transport system fused ATPase/permease subunit
MNWINLFSKKTRRDRYQDWRKNKREKRARRFKQTRDQIYWARFLTYLGRYKASLAGILALIVFGGAVGLVLPFITRFVLDRVVPKHDFRLLNLVILGGFGIYLVNALLDYLEQKLVVTFSMNLITEIRRDLFSHQLKLPLSYYENSSTGKLISKLTYSIYMIKILIETVAYVCLRELALITMIVVAAIMIDWRLTLIFLCLTPFVFLYVNRLNRYMSDVAVQLQTKNDQIIKILDRAFHSAKLFQVFGGGSEEVDKFEKVLNQDKTFRIKRTMVYATNSILINLLSSCIILTALWYGGRQIIHKQLTQGEVIAYIVCLGMLFRPISEFVRASAYLQAGKIGIRSVFSIFENTMPIEEPERPICPLKKEGRIEFRNVWFNYAKGRGGLNKVNFIAEPGQKVLIVGRSGAGKSTLFNLLLRLYECERGGIFIDGINARRMLLKDLRAYFTVVTQDQLHIEDSVLNNIFFGAGMGNGVDIETQLEKALEIGRKMEMNRFVTSLEKRYGHKIDASGLGYSRGELQKLALMRAATKEAPIVLMDEPTASLDHHSEREVLRIIDEQFKGKTTLIISHRPLPQLRPDWIVVLKHGWIEAQGNHHYLMQHSKYYRQLLGRPGEPLAA